MQDYIVHQQQTELEDLKRYFQGSPDELREAVNKMKDAHYRQKDAYLARQQDKRNAMINQGLNPWEFD